MVGEFPELQGVMGGYYAAAQGEDPRIAAAIRDHYKPVGQGDDVPTDPVTVAVSLAERLYVLAAFFDQGIVPTGSKDPFALRRSALGAIQNVLTNSLRFSIAGALELALAATRDGQHYVHETALAPLLDFFADRLKVQQREAGVRHDLIDAVFALGGEDDLVRLLARVHALQAFMATDDGASLLAGYKRAANILKKEAYEPPSPHRGEGRGPLASASGKGEGPTQAPPPETPPHPDQKPPSYTPEKDEAALIAALDTAEPAAAAAVAAEDFTAAMAALATLRAPIDAFFDTVTVNDPDADKRAARLALLARVRDAVHAVADFSRIEG